MKKLLFLTALFVSFNIFSDNNLTNTNKCEFDQGHARKENRMMCGYNSPARYDICGCYDFFVKASFIYWQPISEGLVYATKSTNNPGIPIISRPLYGLISIEPREDFKAGFKVGAGLNSNYDNWDTYIKYTWYKMTQKRTDYPLPDGVLTRIFWSDSFSTQQYCDSISNEWSLNINLVDLELARRAYYGAKFTLRPFFGARASWINQKMHLNYDLLLETTQGYEKINTDSWQLGPRAGMDADALFGYGFRIFGDFAVSILYARYSISSEEFDPSNSQAPNEIALQSDYKLSRVRNNLELAVGLGWGSYISNNTTHFDLSIAYEFNTFLHRIFQISKT